MRVVCYPDCFCIFCLLLFFFLLIRRPPRSTQSGSSASSDVYKRQVQHHIRWISLYYLPEGAKLPIQLAHAEFTAHGDSTTDDTGPAFTNPSMTASVKLAKSGYIKAFEEMQPEHTLMIDLSKSESDILSQMKQKGRYNIKIAEKHGVKVSTGEVKDFYRLYQTMAKRQYNKRFFITKYFFN